MKKIIFITFLNLLLILSSCSNKTNAKKSFVFHFGAVISGVALNGGVFIKATSADKALLVKLGADNSYEFPNGNWKFEIVAFEGPVQFSGRKFCGNIENINLTGTDQSISVEARENICGANQFQDLVVEINQKFGLANVALTNVKIENNQLVITGSNLSGITGINFSNSNINQNLTIASKTSSQIIADFTSNVSLGAGKIFNLMLSDAQATGAFTVDFSLCNSSLFGHGINCSSLPNDRDVLSYDAASGKWLSRSIDGLAYQGVWNPLSGSYPSASSPGDYYIVSTAGTYNSVTYQVGDWLNYNGTTFDKVPHAQNVSSVFGRNGAIVSVKGDYNLNKMADVDLTTTPAVNGDVLKFDGTNWIPSAPSGGGAVTSVNSLTGAVTLSTSNIAEGTNQYFTPARVLSTNITTPSFINSPISGSDTIIASLGKLQGQINNNVMSAGTTSQYMRGDKSWQTLDTSVVPENANLYFTNARTLGVNIVGFSPLAAAITSADTILVAFGKTQGQLNNKSDLSNGTQTITAMTVTGLTSPISTSDAANKDYVDSMISNVVRKNGNPSAYNLAIGTNALPSASGTSYQNTAVGNNSLWYLTNGSNNTALGYGSVSAVTIGSGNTGAGAMSLNYISTGSNNTAIGSQAMWSTTTGGYNVAVGVGAGGGITTGSYNVVIGGNTGSTIATSNNNVLIADGQGTARLMIPSSGFLGVGNTTPTSKVDVGSTSDLLNVVTVNSSGSGRSGILLNTSGINSFQMMSNFSGSAYQGLPTGTAGLITGNPYPIVFAVNQVERMRIDTAGNVGIGTTSPAYTLHVNGSVAGTAAYANVSDERFKKDIEVIPNALEKILKINGVTYNWRQNEFPNKKFSGRTELGVIAQNVEKVFPEAVSTDNEGYRSVAYTMLISPLIEAVKELNQKIVGIFKALQTKAEVAEVKKLEVENTLLKKKNAQIENELSDLKNRMTKLEKLLQK